jgi:hypothetical protein
VLTHAQSVRVYESLPTTDSPGSSRARSRLSRKRLCSKRNWVQLELFGKIVFRVREHFRRGGQCSGPVWSKFSSCPLPHA